MRNLLLSLIFLMGCYLKQYPVTPDVAETATYRLAAGDYLGTAWAVNEHTLITAGHMCEIPGESYVATSTSGRSFRVHSTAWEQGGQGIYDMCALHSEAPLNNWLVIADRLPKLGEQVWYNGFPDGVYVRETGVYIGDTDGKNAHFNDYVATAPSDHGASGSALFTKRGVWGILVRIRTDNGKNGLISNWDDNMHDGKDGESAIGLPQIKAFLDEEQIKYDITPDDPISFIQTSPLG
jgi:hypothetical protein